MLKEYIILWPGHVPDLEKEEAFSRLPQGFELEFLKDKSDKEETTEKLKKADFIIGLGTFSKEELAVASKLKLVQQFGAGYDPAKVEELTQLGIPLSMGGGANAIGVAEHVILLILALYKNLIKNHNNLRNGIWRSDHEDLALNYFELFHKEVGIIGLGMIGKQLAKILQGFQAKVSYYDTIRFTDAENNLGAQYKPLDELLKSSDIISINVSGHLKAIIGERELGLMKSSAILINTTRGDTVDEQALCKALKDKRILGAGLDVFHRENDIREGKYRSPLFELENVVLSPHVAGGTDGRPYRSIQYAYYNFVRVIEGKKPLWVVNEKVLTNKS